MGARASGSTPPSRTANGRPSSGFPGVCRVHRAEVKAVAGAWDSAEEELIRATGSSGATTPRRHRPTATTRSATSAGCAGDFAGAEESLREAHARGRSPQPALALIRLAEGNPKAAFAAINAAVAEAGGDQLDAAAAAARSGGDRYRSGRRRRSRGQPSTSSPESPTSIPPRPLVRTDCSRRGACSSRRATGRPRARRFVRRSRAGARSGRRTRSRGRGPCSRPRFAC